MSTDTSEKELIRLGFIKENNETWVHNGDLQITEDFTPDVNIFIQGNLCTTGHMLVKDLVVDGSIKSNSISCSSLKAKKLTASGYIYSIGHIDIKYEMDVSNDVSCSKLNVGFILKSTGTVSASDITSKYFNLQKVNALSITTK